MPTHLDQSAPVREGEELDAAKLEAFLAESAPEFAGPIEIEQFPGGHSNLTYLIRTPRGELILRRGPLGAHAKAAHNMGREYRILAQLHGHFAPAPEPVANCDDESVIGAPFFLMKRIPGIVYRSNPPEGVSLSPHKVRDICYEFVETLADMHNIDHRDAGLEDIYRGPGYVARQLEGWERRWAAAKTDDVPELDRALEWLKRNLPHDARPAVIHNDYKFNNLVFDGDTLTQLTGVLDWEMATVGDPLSDFAVTLSHWREQTNDPTTTIAACFLCSDTGALTKQELIRTYGRRTGLDLSDLPAHYVLALVKGSVIIQQIYARYKRGQTTDPRFAPMQRVVQDFGNRALRALQTGEV